MGNELAGGRYARSVAALTAAAQSRNVVGRLTLGCTIVAFAVAQGPVAAAPESGAAPPDLARAIAAYDRATAGADIALLTALVADDYTLVNSDMSVQGKASYLADFKRPGFHIDPYRLTDPVLIVRADSALVGGSVRLRWTQDRRSFERQLRIAHFWVREKGRWRLAYTQLTRAPTPSAP